MLDSFDALGQDEAALLLDIGLVWPLGSVRRHALEILAQSDVEEAVRLAAADSDAKVRTWKPRVPPSPGAGPAADPAKDGGLQDSLFDAGID